jgi:hypothetical protein
MPEIKYFDEISIRGDIFKILSMVLKNGKQSFILENEKGGFNYLYYTGGSVPGWYVTLNSQLVEVFFDKKIDNTIFFVSRKAMKEEQ